MTTELPTAPPAPPPPTALAPALLAPAPPAVVYVAPPPASPPAYGSPQVWLVDTATHRVTAARHAPYVLDRQELLRAAEFLHDADRDAYLCAHVGLRRLLGGYLGLPPRGVTVSRAPCPGCGEPHGRPVLPGDSLHFSLSHCEGLSLLAFATTPVGVDVEAVPPLHTVAETADVLHPREAAELAALPPAERALAFTRVWTRKEAYLKGLGVGLSEDPAADYVGSGPVPAPLPGWSLTDVAVPPGHCAAVALNLPAAAPGQRPGTPPHGRG
ncbi:4'-phosphopantetheinyl transferase superfamily protein [Streptomyces bambusae]|uniref:4'-phosphopantetheinyl transferase family protein n=1 Tax=Streptomyces bambusae TaxID=1550616 RepID=UPI001CFCC968|nr:4'-phosphopantetheinyl transferase superfamily protein [Streptomyces bambusae]MCB5163546.1 4'-phosphopantetheinyl transferase superfamily protein [Streptomyces bambusae]